MCGIIGITSKENVKDNLIKCLSNLEYRGYDSVGVYLNKLIKTKGRVKDLVIPSYLDSKVGLGHSRWATHGDISDKNAHPFESDNFVLVHNGIIDNYLEYKEELLLNKYHFKSDTDSEVILNLLECYYKKYQDEVKAFKSVLKLIKGTYALGIIFKKDYNKIYFAKKESPLIIGINDSFNFIVSDINSSYFLTNKFIVLNDYEYGYITNDEVRVFSLDKEIKKDILELDILNKKIDKGNFEHFMIKEIYDEPLVLKKILDTYTLDNKIIISDNLINDLKESKSITILGCGTSYHAGLIGKYVIESLVKKRVNVYLASEFNNVTLLDEDTTYLFLSQSGETIDLKLAYNLIKDKSKIYTFSNVLTSSLCMLSKESFDLCGDIEISVASTKAYVSEVTLLIMLAYKLANLDKEFIDNIYTCINSINKTLKSTSLIKDLAFKIKDYSSLFYLGKGIDHFINLESSLKLKEVSYIHSEALYSGELKHGSIALLSKDSFVIGLLSSLKNKSSFMNNIKEVDARESKYFLVSTSCNDSDFIFDCPNEYFSPICISSFYQLLSYYTALYKGLDIDKPRNLAKSCTVE